MPSLSLGFRLAVIILLGSLLTVAGITTIAYQALVDDFETLLTQQQLNETRRIASEVDERLQLKLDVLAESAAAMTDGQSLLSRNGIQEQLDRQRLLRELFPDGIIVFDDKATAIAENFYVEGRIGTNYGDRDHFRRAIRTRQPVISRPIMGRTTGVPLISFVAPIETDDGDLVGLLGGTINLGKTSLIPEAMRNRLQDENDIFKVIDVENFLYIEGGPVTDKRIQSLPSPGQDPLVDAALSGITFGNVKDSRGRELIYAASHLERIGWMFIRAVPYERATAPARSSFLEFVGISAGIGLLIALFSFLASRSATLPLARITRAIESMAKNPARGQQLPVTGSSETRKLAAAFNDLMRERDAISTMKENFVSNVSHELRTPLTSLNGALRLLTSGTAGALPDQAREMTELAARNGERLQLLISDLLDFNKLSAGQMKVSLSPQPLAPILEATIASQAALAEEHELKLEISGDTHQTVLTDPNRLRQVLDNFVNNAIKFSPPNRTITVSTQRTGPDHTRITVSDSGEGVPAHFEKSLFQRFSQAEVGAAKSIKGTGLGLAICRELATLMQGTVGYYYERGANFWVEIPNVAPAEDRGA